ncbi:FAD-dependent oxidoreductase [Desertivirga xinjiangensis]|uniref:FAD-dependent oxidoreductase n=1 Tax=Desertivirga xinjiangensis TaxID=539206 RepID=UPI00210A0EFD|nr:FAD-dependent oxidoreductase [Pedobacter xinjiangensis]
MLIAKPEERRQLKNITLTGDLVIVGGGLSGVCAAITAARAGVKVVLVQDRPVLGGNASSEVRLWILGATSHMGNNNRWAREGGIIDELLVENMFRNKEGNPLVFDSILLDKVISEPNIHLLLNTVIYEVEKGSENTITSVKGFCSQNSTEYVLSAPLFCDCSGDGILGFLSGAAFRMGAESRDEFDEKFAPTKEYGELLGHSLYFYSKDAGKPVKYVAPDFALSDITAIPRFKNFNTHEFGCKLWWLEYGGRLDTVHDTEKIKWELWKVVYGTWNYIKNSGKFPEAENLTLEWVGTIPGKRESRRFEGDYMLNQKDVIEQRPHFDAVAYGGWSLDLHPADGVYSEKPGCNQWHSKGIYPIPYRCLYSKNVSNLFLAGRVISATHVAFASTRVMATSAYVAQAVGMAARLCMDYNCKPAEIIGLNKIEQLQQSLQQRGQYIPGLSLLDQSDLVKIAKLTASSELKIEGLTHHVEFKPLEVASAQLIPVKEGPFPKLRIPVKATSSTSLTVWLKASSKPGNFTPDLLIKEITLDISSDQSELEIEFDYQVKGGGYFFVCFAKNPDVRIGFSSQRITGLLSVFNHINKAVSNFGRQVPTGDLGVDEFEFWCPKRRPEGHNLALKFEPSLHGFEVENVRNGIDRPVSTINAWVADYTDRQPSLKLSWETPQEISRIEIVFDSDLDHPMESVLMSHPESVMPFCVRNYRLEDGDGNLLYERKGNYQTRNEIKLDKPVSLRELILKVEHPSDLVPAALFAFRCYKR